MSNFPNGGVVTVVNPEDIMSGYQGEVVGSFVDDEDTFEIMVIVKFHVNIVGPRSDLYRDGNYYIGVRHPHSRGLGKFIYQDRSPSPSSIRLDADGYTEENKRKIVVPVADA